MGFLVWGVVPTNLPDVSVSGHPELDWMYINTFYVASDGRPLAQPTSSDGSWHVGSMRKMQELNQELLWVCQSDFDGNTALAVTLNYSVLVLLP